MLIALGMFGVALFYGDGMITPAISVLSAVEGVKVAVPSLGVAGGADHDRRARRPLRDPALRHPRRRARLRAGDGGLVRVIAIAGLGQVVAHPAIVKALSPSYGVEFFAAHPGIAFISLGAIVLTITGAEALYADMGHFGRAADQPRLVLRRLPGADAQLHGPGLADPRHPQRDRQPLLPAVPALGPDPDGGAGDGGDGDRLARRSSRARSRSPARRSSSASCRG